MSGQTNSTLAELSKFNTKVANEHYKVKKEDSLEAILLALHLPGDQVDFLITDFSSNVITVTPGEVGPQPKGDCSLQGPAEPH